MQWALTTWGESDFTKTNPCIVSDATLISPAITCNFYFWFCFVWWSSTPSQQANLDALIPVLWLFTHRLPAYSLRSTCERNLINELITSVNRHESWWDYVMVQEQRQSCHESTHHRMTGSRTWDIQHCFDEFPENPKTVDSCINTQLK